MLAQTVLHVNLSYIFYQSQVGIYRSNVLL